MLIACRKHIWSVKNRSFLAFVKSFLIDLWGTQLDPLMTVGKYSRHNF